MRARTPTPSRRPGRPRGRRGRPRRVRAAAGAGGDPRRPAGRGARDRRQADRRSRPGRRAAAAAAVPRGWPAGSRTTISHRRRWSSGRCSRPACSSGSSSSRSGRRGVPRAPRRTRSRRRPGPRGPRPAGPAGGRAASRPRPRGAGGSRRPAASPAAVSPTAGLITLDWTLLGASAGPRYERWIRVLPRGARGRRGDRWPGDRPTGRPLGPRQVGGARRARRRRPGRPSGRGARRSSRAAGLTGLVRRGLAETEVRERPRRPLGRSARRACAAADRRHRTLSGPQAEAIAHIGARHRGARSAAAAARWRHRRRQDGHLRRGHRRVAGRRGGRRSSSSPRSRWPCRSWIGFGPTSTPGSRSCTRVSATASGPTSGGASGPVTWTSWSARAWPSSRPLADVGLVIVDEEHDPGLQERPDAASAGARRGDPARRPWPGRRACSGRRRRRWTRWVGRSTGPGIGSACRRGRSAKLHASRSWTFALELAEGNRGSAVAPPGRGPGRPGHGGRRAGDPRAQPPRHRVRRAVPRLRSRPGLPGLRAPARLPPGRHDAALPPLRPRDPARHALSRRARRRGSATWVAARSGWSGRSAPRIRACGWRAWTGMSPSGAALRRGSSTTSRPGAPTSSSGRASWPRAWTCRR